MLLRGIVALLMMTSFVFSQTSPSPKVYSINYDTTHKWGKLVSVFDQPNIQRLTFENDEAITIVQLGLTWDGQTKTFQPSLTQVIELRKTGSAMKTQVIPAKE